MFCYKKKSVLYVGKILMYISLSPYFGKKM